MSSVSFVIPVFNKSKFLKYVVKSLKNQSGKFEREFIFIDDGSTDGSYEMILDLTQNLENTRIIKQENMGSANATNVGIKLAKMKYLKFLDADDVILRDTTISLLEILERNEKLVLAFGLQRKVNDLEEADLSEKFDFKNFSLVKNTIKKSMRNSMFNPSQFLARTKLCKEAGGCDERIKFSQEYSLTLRLSLFGNFAKLNYPIAILPIQAKGQISEKKNNQIYRVSKALEFFLEDNPNLSDNLKLYAQRRLTARAWRFAKRYKNSSFFSKWFLLYVVGLLRIKKNLINNCKNSNKVYEDFLD